MNHPFSNATEWRAWESQWCDRCLVDAPFRRGMTPTGCPLILHAVTTDEAPPEWIAQDVDVTDAAGRFHCVDFRPHGWRHPEPRPIPPPPNQGELFPPTPYRGARMLNQPPTRITRDTDEVLAAIDGALGDDDLSDDAMRWVPPRAVSFTVQLTDEQAAAIPWQT